MSLSLLFGVTARILSLSAMNKAGKVRRPFRLEMGSGTGES
jgi:hypothetical protein